MRRHAIEIGDPPAHTKLCLCIVLGYCAAASLFLFGLAGFFIIRDFIL